MFRIRHVLCPVDFSDISQHALDHAAAIAHWYQAPLTLLHVFATVPTMDVPPLVLEDADRACLERSIRKMAARVPADVRVDVRVEQAEHVHSEVLRQLAATGADLLVLGTHGRSGFQRLFLGSVTEKVIRKATCPTLVVPPRVADVPPDAPVHFKRILCGVDFSESSLSALAYALNLAEEADAHLTLLHVIEMPPELRENPMAPALRHRPHPRRGGGGREEAAPRPDSRPSPYLLHRGHGRCGRAGVSACSAAIGRGRGGSDRHGRPRA